MQDVTARWQQQRQMKERVAALEAKLEQVGKSARQDIKTLLVKNEEKD